MSQAPSDAQMISQASKEILAKVRQMVPPLLDKFHKGQMGRIAVVGGSKDYTGAPYFSAMASAKMGADMSHVICTPACAAVIKTYSPDLMVSPLMHESTTNSSPSSSPSPSSASDPTPESIRDTVAAMFPRLHALVVGPGLGRDPLAQAAAALIIRAARAAALPCVVDADALLAVNRDPALVKGWREVVLTPNVVEFKRLADALGVDVEGQGQHSTSGGEGKEEAEEDACTAVARALDGAVVLRKGATDVLSDGTRTWRVEVRGGRKRSGGQGDTLTGCVGTLLCWRRAYRERLWPRGDGDGSSGGGSSELDDAELVLLAAFGGAAVARECSRLAFARHGRALQASDVGAMVPRAFLGVIGEGRREDEPEEGWAEESKL